MALFQYFKHEKSQDYLTGLTILKAGEMVLSIFRVSNEVKVTRETCKSAEKRAYTPYYMATPEEKQIDTHFSENGMTNVFLRRESQSSGG